MIGYDEKRKTYFVQIKVKDKDGKWRSVKKRGFALKREAKAWEAAKTGETQTPVAGMTFLDMATEWERAQQSSEGSKRQHSEHFSIRFSRLYDKQIKTISKADLMNWRSDLAEDERFSTTTKNVTISYVKSVFKYANDVYGLPDPSSVLKRLKKTNEEEMAGEMETWTPEEFSRFVIAVPLRIYQIYFDLLYWTGMRRGEAIALQISDVSSDGWVNIHASQRDAVNGLKPTKTKQCRKIRVDSILLGELNELKNGNSGPYLFGGDHPLSPTTIARVFNAGIKESGVKPIRLHDLRHSHATWLINNGVNIVAVSKRLGHSTIEQTLKTYTHLLSDTDDKMMEVISKKHESM